MKSEMRMKLWVDVWIAVATSSNVSSSHVAAAWADDALEDFDKRFPEHGSGAKEPKEGSSGK